MNWYYVDGPRRVGPVSESDWVELVRSGAIQPETLVWYEGLANWTPFGQIAPPPLPESEELEPDAPEGESVEPVEESEEAVAALAATAYMAHVMDREYSVSLGESLRRAWGLLQAHYWMLAGSTLLTFALVLVGSTLPGLDLFMQIALNGVLFGGLYYLYLQIMRDRPVAALDLFAGFQPGLFRNLLLKTFVASMVTFACVIPVGIAIVATGLLDPNNPTAPDLAKADPVAVMVVALVLLACSIPLIYFMFCWIFALPLIADKRMPFRSAMRLSRKKVLQHPWRLSWIITLSGILVVLPSLILFVALMISNGGDLSQERMASLAEFSKIPMAFTAPLYIGTVVVLYEKIFGEPTPKELPVQEEDESPNA